MTVLEFNHEFDIRYDAIAGKSAPNIDMFEKSVYFTTAQLEIVKGRYSPNSNAKQQGFEATEKRRIDLKELVTNYKTDDFFRNENVINDFSMFVQIPDDTLFIINEQATIVGKGCSKTVEVLPKTHDEYNVEIKNPFKQPNERKIWRMDYSSQDTYKTLELVSSRGVLVTEYNMRYVRHPKPIILVDLNTEFPNENLSIDGYSTVMECELDSSIHREILNRAVELATGDYNPGELNVKTQLNTRDE